MEFAEEMKKRRVHIGMTQKVLGKKIDSVYQMVQKYENGVAEPTYRKFLKICKVLKLDPNDFMEGE